VGDGIAVLSLDRPEARNAMNTQMLEEMLDHLSAVASDEGARALVLTSSDPTAFSAGADVRERLEKEAAIHRMELFARLYDELTAFPKPTIAVCHGACVGGGAEVAAACDLRVAGENLKLRFPGAALGVPVGPARLVTLCGLSVAKDLLLTSRVVGAEEALRWGLVHRVAAADEAEAAALELAGEIAGHPPEAVARLKRMLHEHDGVEERSRGEGRGQVEWQRHGPGLPYSDRP
jgi:enoyl-CoA hydratase/carnithine racemase